MAKFVQLFIILLVGTLLISCGTRTTVEVPPKGGKFASNNSPKALVFPFPAYEGMSSTAWVVLNAKIYERLAYSLAAQNIDPLPYENSLAILQEKGVLKIQEGTAPKINPLMREFLEDPSWSPTMKEEIVRAAYKNYKPPRVTFDLQKWAFFREEELLAAARRQGADLLFCGRITKLSLQDQETMNPFQIGLLPFVTKVPSRLLYGAPDSGRYARLQEVSIGAMLGALIGAEAKDPFEPPRYKTEYLGHPLFPTVTKTKVSGTDDYEVWNSLFWGALGGGVAFLASHGGYAPQASVGLSLTVYDVKSGRKLWMAYTKLKVVPQSVWAARAGDKLLEKALDEAVAKLMSKFWTEVGSSPIQVAQTFPVKEVSLNELARRAEEAARRAEKAALKSERIFERIQVK